VYDFLKALLQKKLDPQIDGQTAVELCKADILAREGAPPVAAAYALPSPVPHAKFEVYLHAASGEVTRVCLVRGNGEICGRKERRVIERDERAG
jgi:hypothetical protein